MITGTVVVFIPHAFSISISRSLYFESFSTAFKEVFLSVGIDISMSKPSEPQLSVCCNPNRGGFGVIDACQRHHPRLWWAGTSIFPK